MINRIKEVITYSGLSERGFAIKCGLKPTTINNQLIGKREISLATIIAISSSFEEISAEWLYAHSKRRNRTRNGQIEKYCIYHSQFAG